MQLPSVSIVTVCFNSKTTIADTLRSVAAQSYPRLEHVVIDGASRDGTAEVVRSFPHVAQFVSEPDEGLYDALNKGIERSSGDIVGILHADDFYPHPRVIQTVVDALLTSRADCTTGDVTIVSPTKPHRVQRYYSAASWHPRQFRFGFMPPHPAFFIWRKHYLRLGPYKTDYRIAADYELLVRYLAVEGLRHVYVPGALVTMRAGGISSAGFRSRFRLNQEVVRACAENGIRTHLPLLALKYFSKLFEYLPHRSRG